MVIRVAKVPNVPLAIAAPGSAVKTMEPTQFAVAAAATMTATMVMSVPLTPAVLASSAILSSQTSRYASQRHVTRAFTSSQAPVSKVSAWMAPTQPAHRQNPAACTRVIHHKAA
jgi:hypothetical protein